MEKKSNIFYIPHTCDKFTTKSSIWKQWSKSRDLSKWKATPFKSLEKIHLNQTKQRLNRRINNKKKNSIFPFKNFNSMETSPHHIQIMTWNEIIWMLHRRRAFIRLIKNQIALWKRNFFFLYWIHQFPFSHEESDVYILHGMGFWRWLRVVAGYNR